MASNIDFVEYVCHQMSQAGFIHYRKMFGEYGIYCDNKFIGVICDNQFFVKKTQAGLKVCSHLQEASPYSGAKPHFVIDDIDNQEFITSLIKATYAELPEPKPKKKKQK